MKRSAFFAIVGAALGIALALPSHAQRAGSESGTGLRMPYQSGFWGYSGFSLGQSKLKAECPGGFSCDDKDQTWRLFGGGRFNNAFGLEVGAMNIGKFQRGGGETDGWGLDFALVAGVPLGTNSAIFGKLGAIYGRTEAEGPGLGLRTGKERGWGPRYGLGGQVGLTPNWALRADLDRYRMDFPGGREDVDTFTLGVQYTFRP
jgi:hypothetical protein